MRSCLCAINWFNKFRLISAAYRQTPNVLSYIEKWKRKTKSREKKMLLLMNNSIIWHTWTRIITAYYSYLFLLLIFIKSIILLAKFFFFLLFVRHNELDAKNDVRSGGKNWSAHKRTGKMRWCHINYNFLFAQINNHA